MFRVFGFGAIHSGLRDGGLGVRGAACRNERDCDHDDGNDDEDGATRILKWMVTTTAMWTTTLSAKMFTLLVLPVVVEMAMLVA